MASFKNKIAQKRLKKQNVQKEQDFKNLKQEMQNLVEDEQYTDAMDVMAEMAEKKIMDGEVMYWGALCYFRTGDYQRCGKWLNHALDNGYRVPEVNILLAAVCFVERRYDDGFKLCQSLLSQNQELTEKADKLLQEVLAPVRERQEMYKEKYAAVKDYAERNKEAIENAQQVKTAVQEIRAEERREENTKSALSKLKNLLAKSKARREEQQAGGLSAIGAEKAASEPLPEHESGTADGAAAGQADRVVNTAPAEKKSGGLTIRRLQLGAQTADGKQEAAAGGRASAAGQGAEAAADDSFDLSGTIAAIRSKEVSQAEKIKLYNVFAGARYTAKAYGDAQKLLEEALQLDAYHADTLKNMAYTYLSMGNTEQAMAMAAKLPVPDFGVLYAMAGK